MNSVFYWRSCPRISLLLFLPKMGHIYLQRRLRFCVLSRKHLDKTARLCYHTLRKWHAFICSNKIFRGIAQLVEQRSPNGNRYLIPHIITWLFRLETSVSSLFSCFDFCKSLKWFMQNRGQNRQKILGQHQKTSNFLLCLERRFSDIWKRLTETFSS